MARSDQTLAVAPAWVEAHCVVPDRFQAGAPFRLYDYQLRYYANFYLVRGTAAWNPRDPILGPAFVYRRGLLIGPQKLGKGPFTASHICLEAVGPALFAGWAGKDDGYACIDHGVCSCDFEYAYAPGEPMGMAWATPLIQITASSEEQTDNIYDSLRPMIELGPLADVIPKTGEAFIRLPGRGRIDTVTSSAKSRLGQRVTFVPQDEVGLWTAENKMLAVADTQYRGLAGMGGRASLTSNAWDPAENSVAQIQYESAAKDIYRQFRQPPANLSYRNKAERRKIHRFVYGEALAESGGHVPLDSIEAEASDLIQRDPEQAERFFGNRLVHGKGAWMVDDLWPRTQVDRPAPPAGTEICLGFDGSESNDWTAIRARTLDGFRFTPTYPVGDEDRPTWWNPAQHNGQIPRGEVNAAVDHLARHYRIVRAYCDPRDWQSEIGDWSLKYGDEVFVEWATYRIRQMHDALVRSVTDLLSGRSTHDQCPFTAAHVANARKLAKPGDRYLLGKPADHQKIDLAMADTLAWEAGEDARLDGWGTPKPTNFLYTA